jgi:hypothetical protein
MKTKLYINIKFLFIMVILTSLISCDPTDTWSTTIINESGKRIKIKIFDNTPNKEFIHEITLENNESISKEYTVSLGGGYHIYEMLEKDNSNQSIGFLSIIYDNSKISEFDFNTESERNLFSYREKVYTFIEEDYLKAENCNGNCE